MKTSSLFHLRRGLRQHGVTLTELMIALVLGALVVLAATAMVVSSRGTYRTQDEGTRLAESSRFALELVNRMVRLSGFTNWGASVNMAATYTKDPAWDSTNAYAINGPNIVGADAAGSHSLPGSGTDLSSGGASSNRSDSLTIRFFGSNKTIGAPQADGNVIDCAGVAVPDAAAASGVSDPIATNAARGYNVLYVANDTDGEPALFCKRQTYDATTALPLSYDAQVLIRGVEAFQVLYGEYVPPLDGVTGLPLSLDDVAPNSIVYRTGVGGTNPVSDWGNVRSIRISMLLRSGVGARADPEPTTNAYQLFGANYPNSGSDVGSSFALTSLSAQERTRLRRVIQTTIFVRNRESAWPVSTP
jgi:type IV pilus assembly protein PilW